jgi:hypothetical protein
MKLKLIAVIAASVAFVAGLSACSEQGDQAAPTSSCAFRVGDGQDGRDANVKEVVYPGDVVDRDKTSSGSFKDEVLYFPCNARNFIVNDGKQTNVDSKRVGDWFKPAVGYTKQGTKVNVYYTMYWTLNQTPSVLKNSFYPFCYKYTCYTRDDAKAGNANFSTTGWNGMLGENFPQAADAIVVRDSKTVLSDASWNQEHNTGEWDALAKQLSESSPTTCSAAVAIPVGQTRRSPVRVSSPAPTCGSRSPASRMPTGLPSRSPTASRSRPHSRTATPPRLRPPRPSTATSPPTGLVCRTRWTSALPRTSPVW